MACGFDCVIMIATVCHLKSFCGLVSPEIIRYSRQLYKNAILMAFMTNGQYHFFPQITGLESNNVRSSRSTPLIPRLYAAITLNILFPFFFCSSLCTSYWLHTIRITSNCNHRIVIPSYNFNVAITPEIKISPFAFLYFFDINQRTIFYNFSLFQLYNTFTQRFITTLIWPFLINFNFIRDSCCTD